jgi:4-hydroxybenzoate polyprenyltransferase
MPQKLSPNTALPLRFLAWMNERFPFDHGILFFVLYATALITGRLAAGSAEITVGLADLVGFVPAWSFFLMLRVFDEHKDYESDCKNYPERVLQSGLVTLGHLKVAGGLAIAAQLGGSVWLDGGFGPITMIWLVVMGYSLLMAKEFFVGEWLGKRLALYAVSHMVVMPMAMVWMAQMGTRGANPTATIGLLAGLSFLSGGAFEVTRKMRGPEEERDEVDSYTKVLGVGGAPIVVMVILGASTAIQVLLLHAIFGGPAHFAWYAVLGAGLVLPMAVLMRFRTAPSAKARKLNELLVSMSMLLSYVVVVSAIVVERGVQWG